MCNSGSFDFQALVVSPNEGFKTRHILGIGLYCIPHPMLSENIRSRKFGKNPGVVIGTTIITVHT